ncbi:MAG TPA: 6-phosphogluconolactonase [Vicinamibacterales bacterium]|nr:6-phosphogluconolactonase [Vicinamibacterales bacterium]
MTPRVVVDDLPRLREILAKEFQTRASEVIARREKCIVALPGGSVASAFFPTLAALAVDWTRIEVFWIDERAVPPDHPDSNFALASKLLLVPARVPGARIHRMYGELPDLEQAARRAADDLKMIAGDPPLIDFVLAGVGDDGHVASIFNDVRRAGLLLETRPVIPIYDAPKPPARRLTLTLPVLARAASLVVAAFGASKAAAMQSALHDASAMTPIAELLRSTPTSLVLLDRNAGLS